jgi:hypothetical protein
MIPAPRTDAHDRLDAQPGRLAYSMTITDHGSADVGGFRTHRATVNTVPAAPKPRTGETQ